MDIAGKVPIIVGDKYYLCSLQVITVKGGKQVIYITDDGTIVKREPLHRYVERQKRREKHSDATGSVGTDLLLMCKDNPVYNITQNKAINEKLLPGAIARNTLDYPNWMRTRYSVGSNVSARRLMLRAFGADSHERALDATRALSLSDCYWLKRQSEDVMFADITPYLNTEWDGTGEFKGGSISTLFVNGAADKRWLNAKTLLKVKSHKEYEAYCVCEKLGLSKYAAKAVVSNEGLLVKNFTSADCFYESFEQSGYAGEGDDARSLAVEKFKEQAVSLFTVDYICEHDDRHWGNFGFLRDANTGEYLAMAPFFDFDWAWSDGVTQLPENALRNYAQLIRDLCERALEATEDLQYGETVKKRAAELLQCVEYR